MDGFGPRIGAIVLACGLVMGIATGCDGASTPRPSDPATVAAVRTLSPQDQHDLDARLSQYAQAMGITDPPDVAVVRLEPASEVTAAMIACLTAAGFSTTLTEDGEGWSSQYSQDQKSAYALASYTCAAQYPLDPAQDDSRMTREQKLIAYHYLTVTLVQCLEDRGYAISEIPTQETFLESWDSAPWNPYDQIPTSPLSLQADCEPNTPSALIWGS